MSPQVWSALAAVLWATGVTGGVLFLTYRLHKYKTRAVAELEATAAAEAAAPPEQAAADLRQS